VYPAEARFREEVASVQDPRGTPPVIEDLEAEAHSRGLWNLFLPRTRQAGHGLSRRPGGLPSLLREPPVSRAL
jgi:acyl-CoA dehydrogenase